VAQGRPTGRYFYEGRAFRVATAGRAQEFLQIGVEHLGEGPDPTDDAAIAAAAWHACAAGGRNDLGLVMGDVGLFDALAAALEIPAVLTARLRRSLSSPAALKDAFERSLAPESRRTGPVAALLAGRPSGRARPCWRTFGP
jgi:ATP phosphoribosyltransferase regulatory subunit